MKCPCILVTGTDTGVGKTVVAVLLCRHLCARGIRVAVVKPFCSGGREDALRLREAAGGRQVLDQVNPWFFRAPLAPLTAARAQKVRIELEQVVDHIRATARGADLCLVEAAGGLLSPLGDGYSARELIVRLRASPVVVCPNRLGAVNQTLLVLRALPASAACRAQVILVSEPEPDTAHRSTIALLRELAPAAGIHVIPWVRRPFGRGPIPERVRERFDELLARWGVAAPPQIPVPSRAACGR